MFEIFGSFSSLPPLLRILGELAEVCLWLLALVTGDTFCGHFLWSLFVVTFGKPFLWTPFCRNFMWKLFVDTFFLTLFVEIFCGYFLCTLFVETFCGDFLWRLFVQKEKKIQIPLLVLSALVKRFSVSHMQDIFLKMIPG